MEARRTAVSETGRFNPLSLMGSWFHAYHETSDPSVEAADAYGQVIGQVGEGLDVIYLCEFLDVNGRADFQQLVDVETMVNNGWRFYDSTDWMRVAYIQQVAKAEAQ